MCSNCSIERNDLTNFLPFLWIYEKKISAIYLKKYFLHSIEFTKFLLLLLFKKIGTYAYECENDFRNFSLLFLTKKRFSMMTLISRNFSFLLWKKWYKWFLHFLMIDLIGLAWNSTVWVFSDLILKYIVRFT